MLWLSVPGLCQSGSVESNEGIFNMVGSQKDKEGNIKGYEEMSKDQMYITAISALVAALGAACTYAINLHKERVREAKETTKEVKEMWLASIQSGNKMAEVVENNNEALENNNGLISKMLDKL